MGRENLEKKNGIRYEGDIKINLDSTLCSNALYVCMCNVYVKTVCITWYSLSYVIDVIHLL